MQSLFLLIIIAAVILSKAGKSISSQMQEQRGEKDESKPTGRAEMPGKAPQGVRRQQTPEQREALRGMKAQSAPLGTVRAQKRRVLQNAEQWREAKRQQDDAGEVHSVRMDTCEGRLESLRILYEAGILDRQEYDERVARTKARHAHGTSEQ